MTSESDAWTAAKKRAKWIPIPNVEPPELRNKELPIDRIKKLTAINDTIDTIITGDNNNNTEPHIKIKNKRIRKLKKTTARATATRLSRPWASDVMRIVVGDSCDEDDNSPEAILKNHYLRNPWFYDTFTHCVSMRIYGGRQHAFLKQYYQEPKLWGGKRMDVRSKNGDLSYWNENTNKCNDDEKEEMVNENKKFSEKWRYYNTILED